MAIALLFMAEEDAFWCLVYIIEHLMPAEYYSRDKQLIGAQVDQVCFTFQPLNCNGQNLSSNRMKEYASGISNIFCIESYIEGNRIHHYTMRRYGRVRGLLGPDEI